MDPAQSHQGTPAYPNVAPPPPRPFAPPMVHLGQQAQGNNAFAAQHGPLACIVALTGDKDDNDGFWPVKYHRSKPITTSNRFGKLNEVDKENKEEEEYQVDYASLDKGVNNTNKIKKIPNPRPDKQCFSKKLKSTINNKLFQLSKEFENIIDDDMKLIEGETDARSLGQEENEYMIDKDDMQDLSEAAKTRALQAPQTPSSALQVAYPSDELTSSNPAEVTLLGTPSTRIGF